MKRKLSFSSLLLIIVLLGLQWSCKKNTTSPSKPNVTIAVVDPSARNFVASAAYVLTPKMCGSYVWDLTTSPGYAYTGFMPFSLAVLIQGAPPQTALVINFNLVCVKIGAPPAVSSQSASTYFNRAWNYAIDFVLVKLNNGTIPLDADAIKGAILASMTRYLGSQIIPAIFNEQRCGNPPIPVPQTPGFC